MIGKTNAGVGSSGFSSVLVTGLSETDTVRMTGIGKTYTPTWVTEKNGWLFEKLSILGECTVTATNGRKTVTEKILIDVFAQYEIEMSYILKLYWLGDMCEEVTGGWETCKMGSAASISPQTDYMDFSLSNYIGAQQEQHTGHIETQNPIDVTDYSSIKLEGIDFYNGGGSSEPYCSVIIRNIKDLDTSDGVQETKYEYKTSGAGSVAEFSISGDISNLSGDMYFIMKNYYASFKVKKLWLE